MEKHLFRSNECNQLFFYFVRWIKKLEKKRTKKNQNRIQLDKKNERERKEFKNSRISQYIITLFIYIIWMDGIFFYFYYILSIQNIKKWFCFCFRFVCFFFFSGSSFFHTVLYRDVKSMWPFHLALSLSLSVSVFHAWVCVCVCEKFFMMKNNLMNEILFCHILALSFFSFCFCFQPIWFHFPILNVSVLMK